MSKASKSSKKPDFRRSLEIVKRLFIENVRKRKIQYLWAIFFMVIIAGSTAGTAAMIRYLVDAVFVEFDPAMLWLVCGAIVGLSVSKGVAVYFQVLITGRIQKSIMGDLQRKQFSKLIASEMTADKSLSSAKKIANIIGRSKSAAFVILTVSRILFRDLLTLIALVAVMVKQDPLMSAIALVVIPCIFVMVSVLSRKIRTLAKNEMNLMGAVHSVGTESLDGIQTVKTFHLEDKVIAAFDKAVQKIQDRNHQLQKITALASPLMETLGAIVIGLFVLYVSWQANTFEKTPGQFMAFLTAFLLAYEPAKRLASVNIQLQRKLVAVEKLFEELDELEAAKASLPKKQLETVKGTVKFDSVSFSYNGREDSVTDVTFEVQAGEKLGIVGRSGAGKTTLINLLLAMIRPQKGTVSVDGVDISTISPESLRSHISIITQDVFLFEGTIEDNIRDGNRKASDEDLKLAIELAQVNPLLERMPEGLQTPLTSHGKGLSGGEKQRVAIARAFLKKAPIIVYDEATSALDGETETLVTNSHHRLGYEPTILCITHRLSTLKLVDRVILMDHGELVAQGTVEEMKRKDERFRSLFHVKET